MRECIHCGEDTRLRNPSGYCDHLHYPESCSICQEMLLKEKGIKKCECCGGTGHVKLED